MVPGQSSLLQRYTECKTFATLFLLLYKVFGSNRNNRKYRKTQKLMIYRVVQKFYMEFNFTFSGRTIKLKSVNCLTMELKSTIYSYHHDIKHGSHKIFVPYGIIQSSGLKTMVNHRQFFKPLQCMVIKSTLVGLYNVGYRPYVALDIITVHLMTVYTHG